MTRAILIGVVVVAVVAGAIWWLCGQNSSAAAPPAPRRRPTADEEAPVVITALGPDWAARFGCTEAELEAALVTGADKELAERVAEETGIVDLRFDGSASGTDVAVTLLVTYASTRERATARLVLPLDDVPGGVRAELMRNQDSPVFRKWSAGS
jgi:hypothetical protein